MNITTEKEKLAALKTIAEAAKSGLMNPPMKGDSKVSEAAVNALAALTEAKKTSSNPHIQTENK